MIRANPRDMCCLIPVALLLAGCPAGAEADGGGLSDAGGSSEAGAPSRWTVVRPAQPGAPNLFGLYALGQDQLIAVGSRGALLRAAPAAGAPDPSLSDIPPALEFGAMALPADLPTPDGQLPDLTAVSGTGPGDVYAVSLGGTDPKNPMGPRLGGVILHYDGTNWQREQPKDAKGAPLALTGDLWGVAAYSGGAMVVGQGGLWLRRVMNAWQPPQSLPAESLNDVFGTGAADLFAVGGNGAAFRWNGSDWEGASPNGFTGKLAGAFGRTSAGGDVYAVGLSGAILKRSGNQLVEYGTRVDPRCGGVALPRVFLRHGAVTPGGQVIVAGWEGAILRLQEAPCRDGGVALTANNESGATQNRLEAVLAVKSRRLSGERTTVYIAGAEGLVLRAEWSE